MSRFGAEERQELSQDNGYARKAYILMAFVLSQVTRITFLGIRKSHLA